MTIIYAGMIVLGFMPLIIILFKKRRINKMRRMGVKTTAVIKELYGRSFKGINRVLIEFNLENGQLVSQEILVGGVPYEPGDKVPLFYDKDNPAKNILDPGKGYIVIIVFTILIALFSIFACFMIQGSIERGEM